MLADKKRHSMKIHAVPLFQNFYLSCLNVEYKAAAHNVLTANHQWVALRI